MDGKRTNAIAELVDLFPTLTALCNLPSPAGLEGVSLEPVLRDPASSVKDVAFTQHPRPSHYYRVPSKRPDAMGMSIRTAHARYTEWRDWTTGKTFARELYLDTDEPAETRSVIDQPHVANIQRESERLLLAQFPIVTHPRDSPEE